MASIPQREYHEILRDLEDLESYLTSLGLHRVDEDRLRGVIANIKELEKARAENRLLAFNTDPRVAELVWSLVEGQELAEIFQGIRGYDPHIVKRLMQRALKGPLHPLHETISSNIGRNTMFELMLAARFRRGGADVALGRRADVVIAHAGSRLYIECKRPLYGHTVERNVKKARQQLRQRFDSDPHPDSTAGLVAISIAKTVNPGSNWLMVDEADDLEQQLSNDMSRIHGLYASDYDCQIDPRLIGMLYHIITPAYLRKSGLLVAASQIAIVLHSKSLNTVFPVSGDALKHLLQRLKPSS